MFDIGFAELIVIAVVALIVIGPERLPETARALGLWAGRLKRLFSEAKSELERELGVDDVRRQLHNEKIMAQLRELDAKPSTDTVEQSEHETDNAAIPSQESAAPPAEAVADTADDERKPSEHNHS